MENQVNVVVPEVSNEGVKVNIVTPAIPTGPVNYVYAGFWMRAVAYIIDYMILIVPVYIFIIVYTLILTAISGIRTVPATRIMSTAYNYYGDPTYITLPATTYLDNPGIFAIGLVFLVIIVVASMFLYNAIFESSKWQATIGKRVMKIIVTDEQGKRISFMRAFGRNAGKLLSGLILDIGYFMAGFTEKKQALHDIMAKTLVLRKA